MQSYWVGRWSLSPLRPRRLIPWVQLVARSVCIAMVGKFGFGLQIKTTHDTDLNTDLCPYQQP